MRRHHLLPLVTLGLLFLVLAARALEATRRYLAAAEPDHGRHVEHEYRHRGDVRDEADDRP
jgi:hypothetical protein